MHHGLDCCHARLDSDQKDAGPPRGNNQNFA